MNLSLVGERECACVCVCVCVPILGVSVLHSCQLD